MMQHYRTELVRDAEALRRAYLRELFAGFFRALQTRRAQTAQSQG